MTIKNGGFAVDGAPVFLIGACAWVGAHAVGKDNDVTSLKAANFGDVGFNALEELLVGPYWLEEDARTLNAENIK